MAYRKIKQNGKPALATRPLKVDNERFVRVINEYVADREKLDKPILLSEISFLLGISMDTLARYRNIRSYADVLKRIDQLSENYWINRGNDKNKPLFAMFMLKAKHGYVEQQYQKVDLNVHGQLGIVQMPSKKPNK